MTPKEHKAFVSELRQMSAYDVRENTKPSVQPVSLKRAMAVTELERRRQARAPDTFTASRSQRTVGLIVLGSLIGAAAYWQFS
jgi:hypothetical protein